MSSEAIGDKAVLGQYTRVVNGIGNLLSSSFEQKWLLNSDLGISIGLSYFRNQSRFQEAYADFRIMFSFHPLPG